MNKNSLTTFALVLGLVLLLQSMFFTSAPKEEVVKEDFSVSVSSTALRPEDFLKVTVVNSLKEDFTIDSNCPSFPLSIKKYENGTWVNIEEKEGQYVKCGESQLAAPTVTEDVFFHQSEQIVLSSDTPTAIDYTPWTSLVFQDEGEYRVDLEVTVDGVEKTFSSPLIKRVKRPWYSALSYQLVFRPIYNVMIFLATHMPGKNAGLAIIILTLIIRLLLYFPNKNALRSQKKMMELRPEFDKIRTQYAGNQEKISHETLALYKKHRVSPVGGCIPLLLQLPILIGLFYVVRDGFNPYQAVYLYDYFDSSVLSTISSNFFGLFNIKETGHPFMAVLVGLIQFSQMRLAFIKNKKSNNNKSSDTGSMQEALQSVNQSMQFILPIMIALMVVSLPSAVGIYLMVSAAFGVLQQFLVNRERN